MTNGVLVDSRQIEDAWHQVLVHFTIGTQWLGRTLIPTIGAIRKLNEIFEITVDARIRREGFAATWEQTIEGGEYVLRRAREIGVCAASLAEASKASHIDEYHVDEASNKVVAWARRMIARNQRRREAIEARAESGSTDSEHESTDSARHLLSLPTAGNLDTGDGVSRLAIQPPDGPSLGAVALLWCEDMP